MMTSEKHSEQEEKKKQDDDQQPVSFTGRICGIGFAGGVFWSLIGYLGYVFHFSEISPNMILQPFMIGEWKKQWLGTMVSIVVIGFISIAGAFIYFVCLKRFKTMWPGMVYGVILWCVVFFLFNPIFEDVKSVTELKSDTIVTTLCLYILYGLFVGYSISFNYNELTSDKLARALGNK